VIAHDGGGVNDARPPTSAGKQWGGSRPPRLSPAIRQNGRSTFYEPRRRTHETRILAADGGGLGHTGEPASRCPARKDPSGLHIVCRGSFRLFAQPQGKDRRPLWGTVEEICEDVRRYADQGLTELFLDGATIERAVEVMEALAPARSIS
jgi:hypothetical protein